MPNSLTATVDNVLDVVLLVVDYTSSPTVTGVTLTRTTPDGTVTAVRGSPAVLSAGYAVFWDDEAPIGVALTYTATGSPGSVVLTASATITGTGVTLAGYLKDPLQPTLDVPLGNVVALRGCDATTGVGVLSFDDDGYENASGIFDVVDYAKPRHIAQARKSQRGRIRLLTEQHTDIQRLRAILASGRTLFMQLPTTLGWALDTYGSDYIAVEDVLSARIGSADMRHTQRMWDIPFRVVDRPVDLLSGQLGGSLVGVDGATWGDLRDSGLHWDNLAIIPGRDRFNRTTASGWGTADVGGTWSIVGGGAATDYSTVPASTGVPGTGQQLNTSTNVVRQIVLPISVTNANCYALVRVDALSVGASNWIEFNLRYTNSSNFYRFRIQFETSAAITALLRKTVIGVTTTLTSGTVAGLTYVAGMWLKTRFYINGTTLQIKVWQFNTPEPNAWTLTTTDSDLASAGQVGVASIVNTGGTTPRTFSTADLVVENLDTSETWLQVAQGVGF